MNIKIMIATHKKYRMPVGIEYLPVHVGADGKESIGYVGDNTGDNISKKNPYYCELTGLYWGWKNLECDFLGLAHYRRHFCLKLKKSNDNFDSVLNSEQIKWLCTNYRVILPKKRRYYIETLYTHYEHTHYSKHLDITRDIIKNKFPDYLKYFDSTLKQTYGYMFNMFVMSKDLVDMYCEWLFDILFELEKNVDCDESLNVNELSVFQARFYVRVSEIIFNVWLNYQMDNGVIGKSQVKEINCIHMEPINWANKISSFLKAKFFKKKYGNSF